MSYPQNFADAYNAASAGLSHAIGFMESAVRLGRGMSRREAEALLETLHAHREAADRKFSDAHEQDLRIW